MALERDDQCDQADKPERKVAGEKPRGRNSCATRASEARRDKEHDNRRGEDQDAGHGAEGRSPNSRWKPCVSIQMIV